MPLLFKLRSISRLSLLIIGLAPALWGAELSAWVGEARPGDEAPPSLCVSRSGLSAYYLEERVELQQRHGSWTLYWSARRPRGFKSEEAVALLTSAEVAELLHTLARRLNAPQLRALRHSSPAPSGGGEDRGGCPKRLSAPQRASSRTPWGVMTQLSLFVAAHERAPEWLLEGLSGAERARQRRDGLWLHWPLGDLEAQLDPSGQEAYGLIESLLQRHLARPLPSDQLLTAAERGQLLVKTDRPARLEIDGVSYGLPTLKPIPVSPGLHSLSLYPLEPPYGPFRYRQIEVEQGKLTRLQLTLE